MHRRLLTRSHRSQGASSSACPRTWSRKQSCWLVGRSDGGQTNEASLRSLDLLTLICSPSVRTQSLCSPWLRKTAISALCSLCCTSDSPFFHFLAFIRFNSSARLSHVPRPSWSAQSPGLFSISQFPSDWQNLIIH